MRYLAIWILAVSLTGYSQNSFAWPGGPGGGPGHGGPGNGGPGHGGPGHGGPGNGGPGHGGPGNGGPGNGPGHPGGPGHGGPGNGGPGHGGPGNGGPGWGHGPGHGGPGTNYVAQFNMNKARLIVTHLYRGVLGRNPDYQGLANFTNVIQQWGYNGLVGEVARGIGNSQEFSNRIGSTNSQVIVATLYDGIFLRQADPQGYQYWVNYVDAIRYGRATGEQLVRDFIETLEFQQMYF